MNCQQLTRLLRLPLCLLLLAGAAHGQGYPPAPGTLHSDFSAQDHAGQTFQLSAQAGKVVVLHYCAMWCSPCIQSAQAEASLTASIDSQLGVGNGIVVDALIENVSTGPTTAADALTWRNFTGTPARTLHLGGNSESGLGLLGSQLTAFPTYVIIDTTGKVSKVILGFSGPSTINAILSAVITAWNARPGAVALASTMSSGQPQSTAGSTLIDSALDPSGGVVADSDNYTLKPGYIGQLYDVAALSITAPFGVSEEEDFLITASGQMDDDTFAQIDSGGVAWSVVSGPVASISASGLAHAAAVPTTLTARVRGEFDGSSAEQDIEVFDGLHDNFGAVAGDGIDDAWQFEFFDADLNGVLDTGEAALAAPTADPDGDGSPNFIEWAAGFQPNSPESVFRFRILGHSSNITQLEISKINPGTVYYLEKSPNLDFTNFGIEIFDFFAESNEENFPLEDDNASETSGFYRLRLEREP